MNILHVSSEVFPYAKTGGLADMTASLAKAQAEAGHRVTLVTPLYRGIREQFDGIRPSGIEFSVALGQAEKTATIWQLDATENFRQSLADGPAHCSVRSG